jgi:hypothetical protein
MVWHAENDDWIMRALKASAEHAEAKEPGELRPPAIIAIVNGDMREVLPGEPEYVKILAQLQQKIEEANAGIVSLADNDNSDTGRPF